MQPQSMRVTLWSRIKLASGLLWIELILCCCLSVASPSSAKDAVSSALKSSALDEDYRKKMEQLTVCGNRPYLDQIAENYRDACDRTAREAQTVIRKSGKKCDHVTMIVPAIEGTHVSEVLCVVRGGDVALGIPTNIVNYVVTPTEIKRLPANAQESSAAVDYAVSRAMGSPTATRTVYLIKFWKLDYNQEQPNIVQVIPVQSQRICNALLNGGDSGFGSFGPAEMFCMVGRPVMPPAWQCQGNIDANPSVTYICNAT